VTDQTDKLQSKVRNFKKQSEEATESAQGSASRYRKLQHELDEAQERAELAEAAVAKSRNRQREQI
jgi:predicted  nucleic acid-binding Zn-ribbon protein